MLFTRLQIKVRLMNYKSLIIYKSNQICVIEVCLNVYLFYVSLSLYGYEKCSDLIKKIISANRKKVLGSLETYFTLPTYYKPNRSNLEALGNKQLLQKYKCHTNKYFAIINKRLY